jgi:DNA-binding SARP family transcriptional activator/tetratricopeptide (TPR) repeat protein
MAGATSIDVHLLGQARVCVGGVPIRLAKRGITLAMFAYLILHRDRAVPRETLAFTLFPELPESDAFKELRRYLYLAQKAMPAGGGPWIEADAESLRWNSGVAATIDIVEFERLAASPATLSAAIGLYEGDLLPEVYDDWIVAERERLRSLYLNALSSLVVQSRSARDFSRAIGFAQQLLSHDPWREDTVRQLIAARYELGDSAGAVSEYERFARSTRSELHIEPMPETRALRDTIARGGALPSSLDRITMGHTAPRPCGLPFAGRRRDLERLRHAWERAARSSGGVVAIEGEPGIGKSRLAAEFALAAEAEGGRVLAGTTSFPEMAPYQSVLEIVRAGLPLLDPARNDSLRMKILAQVLPELQSGDARSAPPDVEAERQQSRLFDAIGATIAALARTRPVCLILEDLHWAGRGTLELLRALARRATNTAILIVVTFRDEEVGAEHPLRTLLRDLAAERLAIRIPLVPLTRDETADVVAAVANTATGALDAQALFAESEGNPLFLSEAIAEALDPASNGDIAPGVQSVIERRLQRLSAEARRVAAVAAVCGNAFDADVACSVAGASGARGLAALDELLERQIVREAGNAAGFAYTFAHHLIAATLYASLPPAERAARHGRVACALERFHHGHLESLASEIARHHDAAGENSEAGRWYARAARAAAAIFAHDEAARFATLAIDRCDDEAERIALRFLRETANARLGRRGDQVRDLDLIDAQADDVATRCESLRRRIAMLRSSADRDAERTAVTALRAQAGTGEDEHWLGVADCAEAWLEISLSRYAPAEPLARRALERLDATGSFGDRLEALSALVEIAIATGRPQEAQAHVASGAALAKEAQDDRSLADVLMQAVSAAVSAQHFDRAFESAERAAALYRSLGDVVGEARALVNLAAAAVRQSHWAIARKANLSAASTFELAGDSRGLARVFMNLAMLHGRCGAIEEGRRYLLLAREQQQRLQDDRAITASLLNESFLALWQRRPEEAFALATQALERAERMNHVSYRAQALANLGAAERDLGRLGPALAHMEEALALQLPLGRLPDAVSDLADIALAHAMTGNLDRAAVHVDEILRIDRSWTNAAIFPPFVAWVAARILNAKGDRRTAATLAWAVALSGEFSASIDVPELAASFAALPFVAEIRTAAADGVWPAFGPLPAPRRHARRTAT